MANLRRTTRHNAIACKSQKKNENNVSKNTSKSNTKSNTKSSKNTKNKLCVNKRIIKSKGGATSKAKILGVIERILKITKSGCSKFISIHPNDLKQNGCKTNEIALFKSNNGVPYLRRDSPLCRKYLVDRRYNGKNGSLLGFKLIGFNKNSYYSRSIPQEVRKLTLEKYSHKCILCGSKDRLEVDHKNGRYNAMTSKVDDFQILCKSCNDKKRERCKKCVSSGTRFNVQEAISSFLYDKPYTQGTSSYTQKHGCKGCFLYDIEDFYKKNNASNKTVQKQANEQTRKVREVSEVCEVNEVHEDIEVQVIIKRMQPISKSAVKGKIGTVIYRHKVVVQD
jgi:hypothetical protein